MLSDKYSQNSLNHAKKSTTNALKSALEKAVQKQKVLKLQIKLQGMYQKVLQRPFHKQINTTHKKHETSKNNNFFDGTTSQPSKIRRKH